MAKTMTTPHSQTSTRIHFVPVGLFATAGFSLLEMALVLLIVSALAGALFVPLRVYREQQARAQTQALLQEAKQALIGHALALHYLPCPDTDAIPDGWENLTGSQACVSSEGVLPWRQLELPATDAWGRFLRYRVDSSFSHHSSWFGISQAENASNIQVQNEAGAVSSNASRPVAVVLSHGQNGWGGVQSLSAGRVSAMGAPIHASEQENVDADNLFIDLAQQQTAAGNYDDMLVMLSPKVLITAMVNAQRLP